MKRFHLHIAVADLAKNIDFYSRLFGTAPTIAKEDYAKWMLDDPRINFAISSRGAAAGIDHIGIQVESEQELAALKAHYDAADASSVSTENSGTCCYAESNKHWLTDPQGIAWEAFHTLSDIPTFSRADANACCTPAPAASDRSVRGKPLSIPIAASPTSHCC